MEIYWRMSEIHRRAELNRPQELMKYIEDCKMKVLEDSVVKQRGRIWYFSVLFHTSYPVALRLTQYSIFRYTFNIFRVWMKMNYCSRIFFIPSCRIAALKVHRFSSRDLDFLLPPKIKHRGLWMVVRNEKAFVLQNIKQWSVKISYCLPSEL